MEVVLVGAMYCVLPMKVNVTGPSPGQVRVGHVKVTICVPDMYPIVQLMSRGKSSTLLAATSVAAGLGLEGAKDILLIAMHASAIDRIRGFFIRGEFLMYLELRSIIRISHTRNNIIHDYDKIVHKVFREYFLDPILYYVWVICARHLLNGAR